MASIITRMRTVQVSRSQAIGISVVTAVIFLLLGFWVFSGPSHRVPPLDEVKATQSQALKAMAGGTVEAAASERGKVKPGGSK